MNQMDFAYLAAKADYDYSKHRLAGEPRLQRYNGKNPDDFVDNTPKGDE